MDYLSRNGASRFARRGCQGNGPEQPRRELDEHSKWTIGCAAGNGDARPGRAPGDGPGTRTGRITALPFADFRSIDIRTDGEPRAARNRAVPGAGWVGGRATLCAFSVCFPSRWTRFLSVRRSALPVSSYSFDVVWLDTCPGVDVSYPAVLLDGRRETTLCVVPLLGFISTQGIAPSFIVGSISVLSMVRPCFYSSPIDQ